MARQKNQPTRWLSPDELAEQPQYVSTLAHGLEVLSCFGPGASALGNKELSERLGLTRPTVSRLTFTLMGLGFLRRDERSGKYALGPGVLSLGYPLLAQLSIRRVAAPAMLELARYAHGPVSIGTRDRLQVVYVETVQGQEVSHTKPDIGTTRPLLSTAIGRALLHLESAEVQQQILEGLKHADPKSWPSGVKALRAGVAQIEARGYCMSWGNWDPTLAAAAVPMRSSVGSLPLAFSVTVPIHLIERPDFESKVAPRLVNLVRNVEYQLG